MYQWLTLSPWRAAPRCYLTTHAWLFFFLIFFETHSSSLSQILWSYLCFSSAALRVSLRAPRGFARWRCSTQRPAPTSPRGSASLGPTELGSCRQAGAVQTPRYPCRSQARLTVTPPQFPQQEGCDFRVRRPRGCRWRERCRLPHAGLQRAPTWHESSWLLGVFSFRKARFLSCENIDISP